MTGTGSAHCRTWSSPVARWCGTLKARVVRMVGPWAIAPFPKPQREPGTTSSTTCLTREHVQERSTQFRIAFGGRLHSDRHQKRQLEHAGIAYKATGASPGTPCSGSCQPNGLLIGDENGDATSAAHIQHGPFYSCSAGCRTQDFLNFINNAPGPGFGIITPVVQWTTPRAES